MNTYEVTLPGLWDEGPLTVVADRVIITDSGALMLQRFNQHDEAVTVAAYESWDSLTLVRNDDQ